MLEEEESWGEESYFSPVEVRGDTSTGASGEPMI